MQQQKGHEASLPVLSLEEARACVRQLEVRSKETELAIKDCKLELASRKTALAGLHTKHSEQQLHPVSIRRSSTRSSSSGRPMQPRYRPVSGLVLFVPSFSCSSNRPALAMPRLVSLRLASSRRSALVSPSLLPPRQTRRHRTFRTSSVKMAALLLQVAELTARLMLFRLVMVVLLRCLMGSLPLIMGPS